SKYQRDQSDQRYGHKSHADDGFAPPRVGGRNAIGGRRDLLFFTGQLRRSSGRDQLHPQPALERRLAIVRELPLPRLERRHYLDIQRRPAQERAAQRYLQSAESEPAAPVELFGDFRRGGGF